jgi:HEPN domain-containing protein
MNGNERKTISGWIDKAANHLYDAREHLKSPYRISESIQDSQVCVELAVKAILALLNIPYPASHGWNRNQLADIAKRIKDQDVLNRLGSLYLHQNVPLPRLLFRANFWSQFYLEAKYGFEAGYLAPAQELFEREDAELAARHANECLGAAFTLQNLPDDQLEALTK